MLTGLASKFPRVGRAEARDLLSALGVAIGVYLALILTVSLIPHAELPNELVLIGICGAMMLALALRLASAPPAIDSCTPFSFLFAAVGVMYVAASMAEVLPTGTLRPVRQDLIFRHSYFLLLWIPLMAGGTALFETIISLVRRFGRHAALPTLILIAAADMLTSIWLGDPDNAWEGYVSYFNPAAMTFLYVGSYFLHVATTARSAVALAFVTGHAILSSTSDYGVMFNTFTGTFSLGCMWAFSIGARWSPRLALYGVVAGGAALIVLLVIGAMAPDIAASDLNTHWRFTVWRENLFTTFDSSFVGVGFGSPYYSISPGNIETAFSLLKTPEFTSHSQASPIEVLYFRAQHSSFVNAFYRMGAAGGGLLIAFVISVLWVSLRAVRSKGGSSAWLAAAGGALFIVEASQVAMHVGLESPRYLCFFALAVGFARAAARSHEQLFDA